MERARHSQSAFRAFLCFPRLFKRAEALLARPARTRAQNGRDTANAHPFLARRRLRDPRAEPASLLSLFAWNSRRNRRPAKESSRTAARESEISLNEPGTKVRELNVRSIRGIHSFEIIICRHTRVTCRVDPRMCNKISAVEILEERQGETATSVI